MPRTTRKKEISFIINGQAFETIEKELSYAQLVELGSDSNQPANTSYSIMYSRGHGNKPEGSLVAGSSVKIKKGMIFDVYPTIQS